jgi:membrane dipeptidase
MPPLQISPRARELHARATVVDLHAHPSLNVSLWQHKFARRHRASGAWNPFTMRTDLPKLMDGNVRVLLSAVYLPERRLLADCWALKVAKCFASPRVRRLFEGSPFDRTLEVIAGFEAEVARSKLDGREVARVVRSRQELETALAEGKLAIIHTIEGAHSLGGSVLNARAFFDRGVCLLTLAHFYANEFVHPVEGIPPEQKIPGCFEEPKDLTRGLTPLGEELVEACVETGMLVDLTHSTPPARQRVFEIVRRRRPLLFTHVGVASLNPQPMNPTDAEIRQIADTGGVVGIILMNHWLTPVKIKQGLHYVVETARRIRDQGGIETVALGTDFDGFTDPPDDVKDMADLPNITEALLRGGFREADIRLILGGNALRVLRQGWGR